MKRYRQVGTRASVDDEGVSVIGTNRDLKSIQRILDCKIIELRQLSNAAPEQRWISDRLATLGRQRIAISAALVNRRIEAAKTVVELSRWFDGNGALGTAVGGSSPPTAWSERP
jgi:hypothetical protein